MFEQTGFVSALNCRSGQAIKSAIPVRVDTARIPKQVECLKGDMHDTAGQPQLYLIAEAATKFGAVSHVVKYVSGTK
jgi:hypothetical protein